MADLFGPCPELVGGRDGQVGDDEPVPDVDLDLHGAILMWVLTYIYNMDECSQDTPHHAGRCVFLLIGT
jgi:hypothetical protein